MSDDGKSSGATIKIIFAVVLFGIAGYFAYANFLAGPKSQKNLKNAADDVPQEVIDENNKIQEEVKNLPPEQVGGA